MMLDRKTIDAIRIEATKNVDRSGEYKLCRATFIWVEMNRLIKERLQAMQKNSCA